jgi:exo-beta-1,3-glucanase (GH17 family)
LRVSRFVCWSTPHGWVRYACRVAVVAREMRQPSFLLLLVSLLACGSSDAGETPPERTSEPCRATTTDVVAALAQCRNWISFEPAAPFNPTQGVATTDSATRASLQQLFDEGWRGIVTYSIDPVQGLDQVPRIAKQVGFQFVIAGLYWYDEAQLSRERAAALDQAQYIDAFVVGNEGLMEGRYTRASLTTELENLHAATKRPVTTSEPDWLYHADPSLLMLGDWVFPNIHPWFADIRSTSSGVSFVENRVSALQQLAPSRTIVLKESWWPTAGGDPAATQDNQSVYFAALAAAGVKFVWGLGYDEYWKTDEGPQGPHWGFHDSQRHAKRLVYDLADVYRSSY